MPAVFPLCLAVHDTPPSSLRGLLLPSKAPLLPVGFEAPVSASFPRQTQSSWCLLSLSSLMHVSRSVPWARRPAEAPNSNITPDQQLLKEISSRVPLDKCSIL